jgi:hypothetical protein
MLVRAYSSDVCLPVLRLGGERRGEEGANECANGSATIHY